MLIINDISQMMVPAERYINATGAAFDIIKSESQLPGAIFGEVAMTCLVTMVVLLVAVNGKTKKTLGSFSWWGVLSSLTFWQGVMCQGRV
ncbi:aquaporin-8a.2 [Scomber scombrus]|uniref:Aquaporin-8a.2 n=1 Tax=Scomber scombrus TaxID=13677 RepID=A0AAV1NRP5_SCOSC